jgi:hypothetical protein
MLGEKLIALRSKVVEQEHRDLLEQLTTKLYYHGHPINRIEAKELGLPIAKPNAPVESARWDLYLAYEEEMNMTAPFDPVAVALAGGLEPPISPGPQQLIYAPFHELVTAPMVIVESEHVVLGVVVGVVEVQRPDRDVHALHDFGSFRLANAETMRAGVCS